MGADTNCRKMRPPVGRIWELISISRFDSGIQRFSWSFDEEDTQCRRVKLELAQCIMELRQCGVTEFQVACDPDVGLYAGETVNITWQNDEAIRLVCVTPFEEQVTKWSL